MSGMNWIKMNDYERSLIRAGELKNDFRWEGNYINKGVKVQEKDPGYFKIYGNNKDHQYFLNGLLPWVIEKTLKAENDQYVPDIVTDAIWKVLSDKGLGDRQILTDAWVKGKAETEAKGERRMDGTLVPYYPDLPSGLSEVFFRDMFFDLAQAVDRSTKLYTDIVKGSVKEDPEL